MASNITKDFQRKAGLSAGGFAPRSDNFTVSDGPDIGLRQTFNDAAAQTAQAHAGPVEPVTAQGDRLRQAFGDAAAQNAQAYAGPPAPQTPAGAPPVAAEQSGDRLRQVFNDAAARDAQAHAGPMPLPSATPAADAFVRPTVTPPMQSMRLAAGNAPGGYTPFDNVVNRFGQAATEMGDAVKGSRLTNNFITNNPATRLAADAVGGVTKAVGKVAPALGAGYEGYRAVQDASDGDTLGAVNHGVNSLASAALYTPAAPVAGAYLGGQAAGSLINSTLAERTKDTIGGVINQGLQNVGKMVGQNWGVDDSNYLAQQASAPTAAGAKPTLRAGAAPASTLAAAPAAAPALDADAGQPTMAPNVARFAQQYGGAAARAAEKLGVDPNMLLAQWGHETGWGKSIIPGTNNLGNIQDVSGGGMAARDNMTGSVDKYRKFSSPEEFADHYAGLIGRKYAGAAGAGTDVNKFTAGLKGYAQDPDYAAKVAAAYRALGGRGGMAQGQTGAPERPSLRPQASWTNEQNIAEDGTNRDGTVQVISGMMRNGRYAGLGATKDEGVLAPFRNQATGDLDKQGALGAMQVQAQRENAQATLGLTAAEHERMAKQFGVSSQREQETQNRLAAADTQNRIQTANTAMQKAIEDHFTTVDPATGKPSFDANKAGTVRRYMDTALGTLASGGKAKSFADLDASDKDKLMAASELMDRVQSEATNWPLGWKPNFLKTSNPLDLIGAEELPNGDLRTPTKTIDGRDVKGGDIIPAWIRRRADGSFFGDKLGFGKPTTAYEKLVGKKVSK